MGSTYFIVNDLHFGKTKLYSKDLSLLEIVLTD